MSILGVNLYENNKKISLSDEIAIQLFYMFVKKFNSENNAALKSKLEQPCLSNNICLRNLDTVFVSDSSYVLAPYQFQWKNSQCNVNTQKDIYKYMLFDVSAATHQ